MASRLLGTSVDWELEVDSKFAAILCIPSYITLPKHLHHLHLVWASPFQTEEKTRVPRH